MRRYIEVSEWSNCDGRGNGFSVKFIDNWSEYKTTYEFEVKELDQKMMRRMTLWINYSEYWNDEEVLMRGEE